MEKFCILISFLFNIKDTSSSQEVELQFQQKLQKLKDEIEVLNIRIYFSEKEKEDEIKALNKSYEQHVSELHTMFKQRMDKIEHAHQKSISDLEQELVKQRERTLKLLDEKDIELDQFKCANGGAVNLFQISPKLANLIDLFGVVVST